MIEARRRRRRKADYRRWERPMELWQLDVMGRVFLADGTELKVVTGIDDHSRFCVLATLVPRATARRVCAAFAEVVIRDLRPMDSGPGDR
jgi:1,2-phenylacetyl-CoA epoxidase catalytic subunit